MPSIQALDTTGLITKMTCENSGAWGFFPHFFFLQKVKMSAQYYRPHNWHTPFWSGIFHTSHSRIKPVSVIQSNSAFPLSMVLIFSLCWEYQMNHPRWLYWVWLSWSSFSPGSPPRAVLCTRSWKGAGNTPEFWLLLSRAGSAPVLSLSTPAWGSRLALGKITVGDTNRAVDPHWPIAFSRPYIISSDTKVSVENNVLEKDSSTPWVCITEHCGQQWWSKHKRALPNIVTGYE